MKIILSMMIALFFTLNSSAFAEKPSWAGMGKPDRDTVEAHSDEMRNKHKDKIKGKKDKKDKKYKDRDGRQDSDSDVSMKRGDSDIDSDSDRKRHADSGDDSGDDSGNDGRNKSYKDKKDRSVKETRGVTRDMLPESGSDRDSDAGPMKRVEREVEKVRENVNLNNGRVEEVKPVPAQQRGFWKFWQ